MILIGKELDKQGLRGVLGSIGGKISDVAFFPHANNCSGLFLTSGGFIKNSKMDYYNLKGYYMTSTTLKSEFYLRIIGLTREGYVNTYSYGILRILKPISTNYQINVRCVKD